MPRRDDRTIDLSGVILPEARTGEPVDLGTADGVAVLTAIRHRF